MVALDGVLAVLESQDNTQAQAVRDSRHAFSQRMENVVRFGIERLGIEAPQRSQTYAREIEITQSLDDIFKIIQRIARIELGLFRLTEAEASEPEGAKEKKKKKKKHKKKKAEAASETSA